METNVEVINVPTWRGGTLHDVRTGAWWHGSFRSLCEAKKRASQHPGAKVFSRLSVFESNRLGLKPVADY